MALVRINARRAELALHGSDRDPSVALRAALLRPGPVILMVHGYKFAPGDPVHCPHRHILSSREGHDCWKARSWPQELRIGANGTVGIAFGWNARGTIWDAYDRAEATGLALVDLVRLIHALSPGREIHAMGHSLGVRVVLSALPHLPAGAISRAVLLAGAEYAARARAALTSPAGRTAQVLHVTSAENRLYDWLLERVITPPEARNRVLGRGLAQFPNLVTLELDDLSLLAALRGLGHPVAPRQRRVCHWSAYLRPGVFALYRALMGPEGDRLFADLVRLSQAQGPRPDRLHRLRLPRGLIGGANAS